MDTYPTAHKNGLPFAFEVENAYALPRRIAHILSHADGVSDVRLTRWSGRATDTRVEFKYPRSRLRRLGAVWRQQPILDWSQEHRRTGPGHHPGRESVQRIPSAVLSGADRRRSHAAHSQAAGRPRLRRTRRLPSPGSKNLAVQPLPRRGRSPSAADFSWRSGCDLLRVVACERDREGIVAKCTQSLTGRNSSTDDEECPTGSRQRARKCEWGRADNSDDFPAQRGA